MRGIGRLTIIAAHGSRQRPDAGPKSPGAPRPRPTIERALADAPPPLARLYSRPNELLSGGPEAFERHAAGPARPSRRREQVGLLVRAVPVRVPVLPEAGRKARQARSPSWRSTPRTRATRRGSSWRSSRSRIPASSTPRATSPKRLGSERNFPTTTFYDRRRRAASTPSPVATPPRRRWRTTSANTPSRGAREGQ